MAEPTKLSIRVAAESHGGRKTRISRLLTLDLLISWIKKLQLDEYTTTGLIALASKYPAAALPSFRRNINLMIHRVRLQRQKDQQGEENYEEKPRPKPVLPPLEDAKQVFDVFNTGPQRVSITEEDLIRDEWESEGGSVEEVAIEDKHDPNAQKELEELEELEEIIEKKLINELVNELNELNELNG